MFVFDLDQSLKVTIFVFYHTFNILYHTNFEGVLPLTDIEMELNSYCTSRDLLEKTVDVNDKEFRVDTDWWVPFGVSEDLPGF